MIDIKTERWDPNHFCEYSEVKCKGEKSSHGYHGLNKYSRMLREGLREPPLRAHRIGNILHFIDTTENKYIWYMQDSNTLFTWNIFEELSE